MSDEGLRQLERRWLETGSFEDEVRWLEGRLRFGELTQGRAWIAGYLGHKATRQVLGLERGDPEIVGVDLEPLEPHLSAAEYDALQIHATAIAVRGPSSPWPEAADAITPCEQALAAVLVWLGCPCQPCAEPLVQLQVACETEEEISAAHLCRAILASEASARSEHLGLAMGLETMQEIRVDHRFSRWEPDTDVRALRMAWRRELVPWALAQKPWSESP